MTQHSGFAGADPVGLPVMLVVGRGGDSAPLVLDGYHFANFASLSLDLLGAVQPDVVLSALVHEDFDAFDLAELLTALRFRGRYRVVAQEIPHPEVVLREVRGAFPSLDFDIMILDQVWLPRL